VNKKLVSSARVWFGTLGYFSGALFGFFRYSVGWTWFASWGVSIGIYVIMYLVLSLVLENKYVK
jgi:hypothetical protein